MVFKRVSFFVHNNNLDHKKVKRICDKLTHYQLLLVVFSVGGFMLRPLKPPCQLLSTQAFLENEPLCTNNQIMKH